MRFHPVITDVDQALAFQPVSSHPGLRVQRAGQMPVALLDLISVRGLSLYQFMPMPGVHKCSHRTLKRRLSFGVSCKNVRS